MYHYYVFFSLDAALFSCYFTPFFFSFHFDTLFFCMLIYLIPCLFGLFLAFRCELNVSCWAITCLRTSKIIHKDMEVVTPVISYLFAFFSCRLFSPIIEFIEIKYSVWVHTYSISSSSAFAPPPSSTFLLSFLIYITYYQRTASNTKWHFLEGYIGLGPTKQIKWMWIKIDDFNNNWCDSPD